MERLDDALLDLRVAGLNLRGATLREHLGDQPMVVAFLRHFG